MENDDKSILMGKYAYQGVPDKRIKPQQGCPDCDRLVRWQHCMALYRKLSQRIS